MTYVSGADLEKYITYILKELGFRNEVPTILYCESMLSIIVDNYNNPIERSGHKYIQNIYQQEFFIPLKMVYNCIRTNPIPHKSPLKHRSGLSIAVTLTV